MTLSLVRDLAAIALQLGIVAAAGGVVARVARIGAPRVALAYWQALLLACLVLPFCQPRREAASWRPAVAAVQIAAQPAGVSEVSSSLLSSPTVSVDGGTWILLALAAGLTGRLLWLILGAFRLRRLRRSATPLVPMPAAFVSAQDKLGTRAEIAVSPQTAGPITFGLRRPIVLLPPSFITMPPHVQEAIACHELLHVRRRDWFFEVLEEGIRAIFWWHPAIWFLIGRIQLAREQVVDQSTIGLTHARDHYVDALLLVALTKSPTTLVPAPLFLRRSLLKQRVAQIFQESTMTTRQLIASLAASAVVLAFAATAAVYAFPLEAEQKQAAPSSGNAPVAIVEGSEHLLHGSVPRYPRRAIEQRVEGDVVLEVTLDERGEVSDTRVLSGPEELRRAALAAVLGWHYAPVRRNTSMTVTLRFKMPANAETGLEARENDRAKAEEFEKVDRARHLSEELHRATEETLIIAKVTGARTTPMKLVQIRAEGVPQSVLEDMVARSGLKVGDPVTDDDVKRLREIAASVDEHLYIVLRPITNGGTILNIVSR